MILLPYLHRHYCGAFVSAARMMRVFCNGRLRPHEFSSQKHYPNHLLFYEARDDPVRMLDLGAPRSSDPVAPYLVVPRWLDPKVPRRLGLGAPRWTDPESLRALDLRAPRFSRPQKISSFLQVPTCRARVAVVVVVVILVVFVTSYMFSILLCCLVVLPFLVLSLL